MFVLVLFFLSEQREKEVKTQRRQLEKLWREESKHLDVVREQEGHGKLDLGVGHALALGPPNYEDLSGLDLRC